MLARIQTGQTMIGVKLAASHYIRPFSREWQRLDATVRNRIETHFGSTPVRISRVAEEFGLEVLLAPLAANVSGEIRPIEVWPRRYRIKINRYESLTRQRFTCAHELAHFFLHEERINSGIVDSVLYRSQLSNALEAEANRLAADLLMPFPLVRQYIDQFCGGDPNAVDPKLMAEHFQVSEMAMRFRLGV